MLSEQEYQNAIEDNTSCQQLTEPQNNEKNCNILKKKFIGGNA